MRLVSFNNNSNSIVSLVVDLPIMNQCIRFNPKVKEYNREYEFNYNKEMDDGRIISPQQKSINSEEENNSNNKDKDNNSNNKDVESQIKKVENGNNTYSISISSGSNSNSMKIQESILHEVEELGYDKKYTMKCLLDNELNYATASYYLLLYSEG